MRECGMLLPVSSLPSRYGIGAFSGEAYDFIDTLQRAGQKYWQILPLGPTGYGDSPYQSFSAFSGNPYFIDLEAFIEEELLTKEECDRADFGDNRRYISYDKLYQNRFPLLKLAFERWMEKNGKNKAKKYFAKSLTAETREYCLYMAIKNDYDGEPWINWDKPIRLHQPDAVKSFAQKLENEIMFYQFQQLKFQEQWKRLKAYANAHEIKIIGDIPIYVAFDRCLGTSGTFSV